MLASVAIAAVGCDQGHADDDPRSGEPIRIVWSNVGPGKDLPADGEILIQTSRLLHPLTTTRQSFVLVDGSNEPLDPPVVTYDPGQRLTRISNPSNAGSAWLVPGRFYKLVMRVPEGDEETRGMRAIDRATLEAPLVLAFFAGPPTGEARAETARFCSDILPVLRAHCALAGCHSRREDAPAPAMGLELDSAEGIERTVFRVARLAPAAGQNVGGGPPTRTFGVDMPIVTRRNPAQSFLLYKTLLDPSSELEQPWPDSCDGTPARTSPVRAIGAPVDGVLGPADRAALANVIVGASMPPPGSAAPGLSVEARARLGAWIAEGAPTEPCDRCAP